MIVERGGTIAKIDLAAPLDLEESPKMGKVLSFYSDRDGIGRSMAVASVAWILASNGWRVLAIDWDLTKPTLHKYFAPLIEKRTNLGLIDCLWEYAKSSRHLPPVEREMRAAQPPEIETWRCNSGDSGQLDVLFAAGTRTSEIRARYFAWAEFFDQLYGGRLLQALFTKFCAEYDFVLVDLPSGSNMRQALLNIGRLSEELVVCFSYDAESIEQTVKNVSLIPSVEHGNPRFVPAAMMVDNAEAELMHETRLNAEKRFQVLQPSVSGLWAELPNIPYYRYRRQLPRGDFPGRSFLYFAEVATSLQGLHWIDPSEWIASHVSKAKNGDDEQLDSYFATPDEGSSSYIFVSYARDEKDTMLFFISDLARLGFPVWWDEAIPGGAEWASYLERKIVEAKLFMLFLSRRSISSEPVAREISIAERSRIPILSIRLDAAEPPEGINAAVLKYQTLQSDSATFREDLVKAIRFLGVD